MLLALLMAAEASGGDPTVGIIGAIGALLVGILTALGVYIKNADARADRLSGRTEAVLEAQVTDAREGEDQMRKERDEALAREAAAYKERDKWMEMWADEQAKANALEVKVMLLRRTQDPNGEGT